MNISQEIKLIFLSLIYSKSNNILLNDENLKLNKIYDRIILLNK